MLQPEAKPHMEVFILSLVYLILLNRLNDWFILSKLWHFSLEEHPLTFPGWFTLWHHWEPSSSTWWRLGIGGKRNYGEREKTAYVWEVKYHTHILRLLLSAGSPCAAAGCWNKAGKAVGRRIREAVTRGDRANRAWSNLVTQITGRAARQWVR